MNIKASDFQFPDDAEAHFKDIFDKTAIFRKQRVHDYGGYGGPWVENIFIANYSSLPLSHFHGFIPIFIQWVDVQIHNYWINPDKLLDDVLEALDSVLRKNVLYLAISQSDIGLGKSISSTHPNILVLSAGGFGHVPIPLIKGELPWTELPAKFSTLALVPW